MKKCILSAVMLLFFTSTVFSADLDPAYRKAFGSGIIIVTNGDYPPLLKFNPSQFNFKDGVFSIKLNPSEPVNLRAIPPAGKRWKVFYNQTVKEQPGNLKYLKSKIFYWQIWTDRDSKGNILDPKKNPWPKDVSTVPNWNPVGWFTSMYDDEAGEWDTIGINNDTFIADANQFFYNAQDDQKFYITVSLGYSYIVGAGQKEQKWNSVLKRFEGVESSGELGFAVSKPICGSTIIVTNTNE